MIYTIIKIWSIIYIIVGIIYALWEMPKLSMFPDTLLQYMIKVLFHIILIGIWPIWLRSDINARKQNKKITIYRATCRTKKNEKNRLIKERIQLSRKITHAKKMIRLGYHPDNFRKYLKRYYERQALLIKREREM